MKASKIITIITIIILVAILTCASFIGIFKLNNYKVKNIVPEYVFGKEFSKSRVIQLKVDTTIDSTTIYDKDGNEVIDLEENVEYSQDAGYTVIENRVNPQEALTQENYKKAKKIITKRLHDLGVDEYTINQDEETGDINLELAESKETDDIIELLIQNGTFALKDVENEVILLNTDDIVKTNVNYMQLSNNYVGAFLNLEVKNDAKSKLQEMNEKYIKTTEKVTNENGEEEDKEVTKDVSIIINGETIRNTHFGSKTVDEIIVSGKTMSILIGAADDNATIQKYHDQAENISVLIDNGTMPLVYTQTSEVKDNSINVLENKIIVYSLIGIMLLAVLVLLIKLKLKGILAVILEIGYISLLLLVLRCISIKITLTGIVGIATAIILNYVYIYLAFKNEKLNFVKDTTKKIAIKLIPFYIVAIVFPFIKLATFSSLGMTLFWGIIVMYLYNLSITQITIETTKE